MAHIFKNSGTSQPVSEEAAKSFHQMLIQMIEALFHASLLRWYLGVRSLTTALKL